MERKESNLMKAPTILVVEDESIVAMDMERRLKGLGYDVLGRVLTGADAVVKAKELLPDVVLMDIHLKGEMDGIEAASRIHREHEIPVIYITAYSDDATLERAKKTQPYGYILKPFQEREIHSVIEMTLFKAKAEAELRRAKKEAEEGLRIKNEFLSNMSHEFRTPLNSILGMAHLAKEHAQSPEVREYLDLVLESGNGLLDMINSVLDYSKLENRKLSVELGWLDIPILIKELEKRFAFQIRANTIHCSIKVDPALPGKIHCDAEKVRQIIQHLLSNAVKFTHSGTVELSLKAKTEIDHTGGMMEIVVSDTGVGIQEMQQERIFQAFAQADSSATRTFGGTGLGLAIVKRYVEELGGTITLSSTPSKGSVFSVLLPVAESDVDQGRMEEAICVELGDKVEHEILPESLQDFILLCRDLLEKRDWHRLESAAEASRGHFERLGYGNVKDYLLRVLLGARKCSVERSTQAIDLLDEYYRQQGE